jgi:hypothetical protein
VKKKKTKARELFPKQILVSHHEDSVESWLAVESEDLGGIDGETVGVYRLVEVKKVSISVTLV